MAEEKKPFDKTAFVFNTPIEKLKECLLTCEEELVRLLTIPKPDPWVQERIDDLTYWLGVWELQLPDAERRKMTTVPMSAIERVVLGLYQKPEEPYKPKPKPKRKPVEQVKEKKRAVKKKKPV